MARYEHLPVYKLAMEIGVLLQEVVRKFSRYNKYSIGSDLREISRHIISILSKKGQETMQRYFLIPIVSLFIFCSAAYAEMWDNRDGTVSDTTAGLMWQKGEAGAMRWENALSYCENLVLAGYDDWRLPNRNELQSLVDYSRTDPAIDIVAFPDALSGHYWSSTTYARYPDDAWLVHFKYGAVFSHGQLKSHSYYVRAVRGGQ